MVSYADYTYPSSTVNYPQQPNGYYAQQPASNNPWEFENNWSHKLSDCCQYRDEMCYGLWCFPCFACHLAWRMQESCWITCCLPSYLAILRTKMRTAFRIKGSYLSDLCVAECCPLCAALQMASELRFRNVMN